jgi:DNA polymerase sigma
MENKKPIKVSDGNLGRLFMEFLWYYGLVFDQTKYVIYAYPTDNMGDRESNFLYVS